MVERYYKDKEWKIAQSRYIETRNLGDKGIKVVPIVTGGYKASDNYHQDTEECILKATAFELSKYTIEQLKKRIEVLLDNNE